MAYDEYAPDAPSACSVSEAMALAKSALESVTLVVEGEVSEFSHKTGYKAVYFTLKDENASLSCMMWVNRFTKDGVEMRVGSVVRVTGRFTLYAAKGRMNFDVVHIELAGEGDLRQRVALLERKLRAEGLMDPAAKQPLPEFPQKVGVVTSPRGAAIRDILRTLKRRYPLAEVLIAGVPVEGVEAARKMCEALLLLDRSDAEVIILGRGGGSYEDLMPFNDEQLARTIYALNTPVVTGIGHEPDTSIADLVADVRASTPTAAAEAVSPDSANVSHDIALRLSSSGLRLRRRLEHSREVLEKTATRPVLSDPRTMFSADTMHLEGARKRMELSGPAAMRTRRNDLAMRAARLNDLSPLAVLARGYSMTTTTDGRLVKRASEAKVGDELQVRMADGSIGCHVSRVECTA